MVSDVLTIQLLEYNVEMGRFFKRGCEFDTTNASSTFSFLVMCPKYVLGHVGRNNIKINPVLFIVPKTKIRLRDELSIESKRIDSRDFLSYQDLV